MSKTIAVLGATGAQGGSVARHLLKDGEFKVRAITRNPDSDAAKALAAAGAEVVKADVLDPASLTDCFKGCHGVFDVTMFWAHLSVEKEEAEVKNVTEAAKAAGVHHFIYSTLADSRTFNLDVPPVEGMPPTYRVPHFDGKVDFQKKYVEGAFPCLSLVHAAAYWSNLWAFGFLMRNEHTGGKLAYGTNQRDTATFHGIDIENDFGRFVVKMFKMGDEANGLELQAISGLNTIADIRATVGAALGEEVISATVDRDTFAGFGFPGAADLANMFELFSCPDWERYIKAEYEKSKAFLPDCKTFKEFAEANKDKMKM